MECGTHTLMDGSQGFMLRITNEPSSMQRRLSPRRKGALDWILGDETATNEAQRVIDGFETTRGWD